MKKYFIRRTRVLSETVEVYAKTKNEAIAKSKDLSLSVYDTRSRWSRSSVINAGDEFDPIELESLAVLAIKLSDQDYGYEIYNGPFIENNEILTDTFDFNTRGFVKSAYIEDKEINVSFGDSYSAGISELATNVQIEVLRSIVKSAKINGVNLPQNLSDIKVIYTDRVYTSKTPWTVVDARDGWISLKRNRIVTTVAFDQLKWDNYKIKD